MMKKLSLIFAIVTVFALLLSACSHGGNEPALDTDDAKITTDAPTTVSSTTQAPQNPIEPNNPEPIYVGMSADEFYAACQDMEESYRAFLSFLMYLRTPKRKREP